MVFDIVNFYPSISQQLLTTALTWEIPHMPISELDFSIIMHVKKSVLSSNGTHWPKRGYPNSFDVTMGSIDGAEVCELVGLYILNSLSRQCQRSPMSASTKMLVYHP
ncbi:hypothetical protein HOLleu_13764 [Holothuria leucospilota]|uniref:Uncharacterized protein n=1 Tax=Holothuria leucospilota TaxID=206669 RepID=A0A9Q1C7R1_HOLLE|nr:hypothetical protein HOLleu_13764 [Holothuria leucospilota]